MSNQTKSGTDPTESTSFGRTYWMLNSIEAFERLAYFGIRAVVPLYIMQVSEPGGLHLTAWHKGTIYAWWAVFQSFLPIITGGLADRYGYKKTMAFAITMNVIGYVMMANLHSFWGFFAGILVLATGTAFFKPSLQGSLAVNLNKANSSMGWGIFYWVVNVGAFSAPFMSTAILGKPHSAEGWQTLFYTCAAFTSVNILLLFTFKDVPSGASKSESVGQVLRRTLVNILETRLIIWLLIMSCFWLMMYQLWDLHPNFITDWVDSTDLAQLVPFDSWWEYGDRGNIQVPQQILLNLNAGLIILLIVPLSKFSAKMRTLRAMLVGMSVATIGVLVAGLTGNGWILLLGIAFFSLGEMWTGPKKNEYLGLIAPPGKKGLYLGYVNIPVGIGLFVGSYVAGFVYDNYGEKASLALKELASQKSLVSQAAKAVDWSDGLGKIHGLIGIENGQAFVRLQKEAKLTASQAQTRLLDHFRHDKGQIINLGHRHLAHQESYRERLPNYFKGKPPQWVQDILTKAGQDAAQPEMAKRLLKELWQRANELGKATGIKRSNVWALLRETVNNAPGTKEEAIDDAQITKMLWDKYGSQPDVINCLALEYLAQGTDLVSKAVAKFDYTDPRSDLPAKAGINRIKSFNALAVTAGVTAAELDAKLADLKVKSDDQHAAVYAYLMSLPHCRFNAIASHDWPKNQTWLKRLIETSPAAQDVINKADEGKAIPFDQLVTNFTKLQETLAAIDWQQHPEQAAYVLGLNPFEARARARAEINGSHLTVTKQLWDKYLPHYKVWIPFAIIGVIATIALGIFGQMAKRWKDMNA